MKWAIRELYVHIESAIRQGIYLTVLSLCLAITIGLYIAKSISNPLMKLVRGAKDIGNGKLDVSVDIDTQGELQLLANSFNQMARELQQKIESINEANKELHEANETKDAFFSIIAHDLRNPFNAILGYSYLLSENYDDFDEVERKQFIAEIDRSSRITFELLENLLNWARAQSGKIELQPELVDLHDLVEKSTDAHASNAQAKHIQMTNVLPSPFEVRLDLNTMQVVLNNLISNAVKFTPDGGHILISGHQSETEICLSVKDTGVGMSEDVIRRLFLLEGTYSTPGTENENGTGLGLVLVKDFVQKNGGHLEVHSELGEGTEFVIHLPSK